MRMRMSMAVSHVMFMPFMAWHMHVLYICAHVYAICAHVCAVSVVYVYHDVSVTCAIVLRISHGITCELGVLTIVLLHVWRRHVHICVCARCLSWLSYASAWNT
jgi:hypothetical protein